MGWRWFIVSFNSKEEEGLILDRGRHCYDTKENCAAAAKEMINNGYDMICCHWGPFILVDYFKCSCDKEKQKHSMSI